MPTKRICSFCKNPSEFYLFDLKEGRWSSNIDSRGKTSAVCRNCGDEKASFDCHFLQCGYLSPTERTKYMSISSSTYRDTFIHKGIAVIPFDEVLGGSLSFTSTVAKIIKEKNLEDINNLHLLSDSVDLKNRTKLKHPCRKWVNIWGDTDSLVKKEKAGAFLMKRTRNIGFDLERLLFPEISYGRKMVDRKRKILKHNPDMESSLICDKINVLVRFAGLDTEQHLHRDSFDFGLSVVLVLECHEKYSFRYVRGSHELSYNDDIKDLNISAADLETIKVEKGNCICFASNLVHGGGASSIKSDQPTSQLSDLSIHIDFSHEGLSKGSSRANGVTHIWPFSLDQGESHNCEAVYKYKGESPNFKKAVDKATSSWVDMYGGEGRKRPRRI